MHAKALAAMHRLMKVRILSCFMAVDITQHRNQKALLTLLVLSEKECPYSIQKSYFYLFLNK